MPSTRSLEIRFWEKVDSRGPDECWPWTAARNACGYGVMRDGLAHRISWQLVHGRPVPIGMVVCHSCDTPECVNPEHLWLGTQGDNIADMFSKGRGKPVSPSDHRGAKNPMAKLTDASVAEIRSLIGTLSQREIAERFGVTQSTVSRLASGKRRPCLTE